MTITEQADVLQLIENDLRAVLRTGDKKGLNLNLARMRLGIVREEIHPENLAKLEMVEEALATLAGQRSGSMEPSE